ncbi:MAG: ABC transporter ATP-binding protein [Gammaproteobacteria bacterium]|nr:MAG: ABC transporter ATP-binding protein [Gammaproteobacteria bacterium]
MLEVSQLTRYYGEFKAVDNVSFKIGQGEIVGLLGHNGAGKTTIMKMISGFLEPNEGNIKIDGIDMQLDLKRAQRSIGYLPENLPIYPEMTVADYLDYVGDMKGLSGEQKIAEIKRVIRATSLQEKLLSPIATLSRGYKQRVGVAQAILGQPRLLILDEPTNGLDPTQTQQMRELIRELSSQATVILSTHIMQEVDAICDRALIICQGALAVNASLEELRTSNHLLVTTSLEQPAVEQQLAGLAGVAAIEVAAAEDDDSDGTEVHCYRIEVAEGTDPLQLGAAINKQLVAAGAEVYGIGRERRDLETLFREVNTAPATNSKEDVKDAA